MQVQLREGHGNASVLEPVVDAAVEVVAHGQAVFDLAHVGAQLEALAVAFQRHEPAVGLGLAQHLGVLPGNVQQHVAHLLGVVAVGHGHVDHQAGHVVAQGPVRHLARDEGLVGDDDFLVVEVQHRGGPRADARDGAGEGVDGDDIAHAEGPLHQQYQARDEVGEDLLQAEAQAHGERRHHPLQLAPAQAQQREGADRARDGDGVARQRGQGVARGAADAVGGRQRHFQQAGQVACKAEGEQQDHHAQQRIHQAHGGGMRDAVGAGVGGVPEHHAFGAQQRRQHGQPGVDQGQHDQHLLQQAQQPVRLGAHGDQGHLGGFVGGGLAGVHSRAALGQPGGFAQPVQRQAPLAQQQPAPQQVDHDLDRAQEHEAGHQGLDDFGGRVDIAEHDAHGQRAEHEHQHHADDLAPVDAGPLLLHDTAKVQPGHPGQPQ